jgi:hypothetical protein
MTERNPRPSVKDGENREERRRGGEEERRRGGVRGFFVSFPPPLPVSSFPLVIDNRARQRSAI